MTPSPTAPPPGPLASPAGAVARRDRRRTSRVVPALVATFVVAVVLALPAALAGVVPDALPQACASAEGQVRASLVVDFGTVEGLGSRPANTDDCITLAAGGNGATLIAQRFGKSTIRINSSGLICAIDGYPATGCGEHLPNGKYRYWSYWKGGSRWDYATIGPADRKIVDGSVEGWRFGDGSTDVNELQPRSSAAGACSSSSPTSPPVTAAPSGPGGGTGTPTTPTTATGSGSGGSEPSAVDPSAGATDQPPGAMVDPASDVSAGAEASGDDDGTTGTSADSSLGAAENAAAVSGHDSKSGGGPVIAAAVALAVVALGGGAALRFRTKSDS